MHRGLFVSASSHPVLRDALVPERVALWRALAAGSLVSMSSVFLAGTSAWLIVRAAQRPAILSLTVPMGLVQLFALSKAAGRYVERVQTHRAVLGVMGHLRERVARLLEPLIPAGLGPRSADVVDVVLRDVERVQDLLTVVAGPLLTSVIAGLVTALITGFVVPWTALSLTAALLVGGVLLPVVAQRLGEHCESTMDRARSQMVTFFDDVVQSGEEFIMTGASLGLDRRLEALERTFDQAQKRRHAITGVVDGLNTLIAGGAVVGALGFTVLAVDQGHLSRALIAVPALLSVAALELVGGATLALVGLGGDRAALSRIESMREVALPVSEPEMAGRTIDANSSVALHDVSHRFADLKVLRDVSFQLSPGDVVVLSGQSGSGKTTLARLLAKFLDPSQGSVDLDDTAYRTLLSSQVRSHVGFVDDAPYVFSATLEANLRIAKPSATQEELLRACWGAGLRPLLQSLPEGLATELGGPTTGLSGGERRRLGIARELLVNRPVVVFDEPTEGLDEDAAEFVLRQIRDRYHLGVVLVISHRTPNGLRATRRLDLHGGSVTEEKSESLAT